MWAQGGWLVQANGAGKVHTAYRLTSVGLSCNFLFFKNTHDTRRAISLFFFFVVFGSIFLCLAGTCERTGADRETSIVFFFACVCVYLFFFFCSALSFFFFFL
eukprot:TRINITY_DN2521_c4_g1_i1.p2 TRINITY_DN2521_c4_g1~~TRINITY_DN2521_c4_g1_i1.p2  ORF type:complete len:103 (-),score=2.88 TRINITY_DN2521_c4_g1_i1:410-718(-)